MKSGIIFTFFASHWLSQRKLDSYIFCIQSIVISRVLRPLETPLGAWERTRVKKSNITMEIVLTLQNPPEKFLGIAQSALAQTSIKMIETRWLRL